MRCVLNKGCINVHSLLYSYIYHLLIKFARPMEEKIFEFKNIFVELVNKDKKVDAKYVRLLDGISGKFKSGRLTAVMGASGAGKSTLFEVLLGRIENSSKTFGSILYNGKERDTEEWIHQVSYLKQFDAYFPKFSIMESIMYNLDFYKSHLSNKEKITFSEEILKMSNIFEKRYAYVESLSGGECKRAMIALSLCADPEIIFMDEPTSGLDSHSALTLMDFMKDYAEQNNKIVVVSLHQPGEALFSLFEDILYLGRGGIFYDGKVEKIGSWLDEKGLKKLEGMSLAEYLFELHSEKPYPPVISQTKPIVEQIIETNRQEYKELRENLELKNGLSSLLTRYSLSFGDIITLWRRFYLNVWRTENMFITVSLRMLIVAANFILMILTSKNNLSCSSTKLISNKSITLKEAVDHWSKDISEIDVSQFTVSLAKDSCYYIMAFSTKFFMYDFVYYKELITEDIYSAKFSSFSYFIAYVLSDIANSIFWFMLSPFFVYLTSLKHLINGKYLIYVISFAICYAIGAIFANRICFGSTRIASGFFALLLIFCMHHSSVFLFDFVVKLEKDYLSWFKYCSYIYLFFPHIILWHIIEYREVDFLYKTLDKSEDLSAIKGKGTLRFVVKEWVFDFLRFDRLPPLWSCYALLAISIVLNITVSLYLLNRQTRSYMRVKLN